MSVLKKISIVLACMLSYVNAYTPYSPPVDIPDDRKTIPEPPLNFKNVNQNIYNRQFTQPMDRFWDFSRWLRAIGGNPKEAMNLTPFDGVKNSSWYENRNTVKPFSVAEIRKGPRTIDGPDTSGIWTIFKVKADGMAPGFWIKDEQGNRFIIKPEVKGYPEVGTSAENITTLLFYAAGYHVPENYLTDVDTARIKIKDGVMFTDSRGVKRPMKKKDLQEIFDRIHIRDNGKVRVTASRFINGKPVGSYRFHGFRKGDPNDKVPHQHRRELRGLHVLCAWLNHHDLNSGNFFESYVNDNGQKYIRRYLLDFSSTLGASLFGAQPRNRGYKRLFNPIDVFLINLPTAGVYAQEWERKNPITHPIIGRFNNNIFKPNGFLINYPLEAFQLRTDLDGYWGAKIVMSFTNDQIHAVVQEGQYSVPEANDVLADILIERRNLIGKYWYERVNPLEEFTVINDEKKLCFTDLGLLQNLYDLQGTEYHYYVEHNGVQKGEGTTKVPCLDFPDLGKDIASPIDELVYTIRTKRDNDEPGDYIKAYVQSKDGKKYSVAGIKRESN